MSVAVQIGVATLGGSISRRADVDLNYLLHRQQVERSRAEHAPTEAARKAHEDLAKRYEMQIEALSGDDFSIASTEAPGERA